MQNLKKVQNLKKQKKIVTTANNNKMEGIGKRKSEKNSKTNTSNNKNSEQDISHEAEPVNTSNSQENMENNEIEREKDVPLQNQDISPEKNYDQIAKWLGNGKENTI